MSVPFSFDLFGCLFIFKEIYVLEFCSYDYLYCLFLICLLKVLKQALDSQEEKEWYWFLFKSCSSPWKSLSKLRNRKQLPRQRLQFPYHIEVVGQNALPGKILVNLGESGFPQDHLSNIIFHPSASHVSYSNLIAFCTGPRRIQAYSSVQFSSDPQSCPTLCDPMNCSMPGLPVHHQLPEFTQTHIHQVGDAIQPFHPLSSPSPPAPNPSQHQSLFQWVNSSHEVAKVLEFQL